MKQMTQTGTLNIGLRDEHGVWHKDFEMRSPTMADVDEVLSQLDENASRAKVNRYLWARTLLRIGSITDITPDVLGQLADIEYGVLSEAEVELKKKLLQESRGSKSAEPLNSA